MSLRASTPTIVPKTSLGQCSKLGDMEATRLKLRSQGEGRCFGMAMERQASVQRMEGRAKVGRGRGPTSVQMQCCNAPPTVCGSAARLDAA
jgi:hypothetical protein